ncbi:hypothetical protein GCM10022247_03860 [Allokutzneria multivorans]|uniref:Secreted protein n=1 Tax=Allokutzneria multivorans TaxID=1142134 RepID=A0ABP7QX91_9PSEU
MAGFCGRIGVFACVLCHVAGYAQFADVAQEVEACPIGDVVSVAVAEVSVVGGGDPVEAGVLDRGEVCDCVYGCIYAVRAILPRGSTLVVWEPGATRPLQLPGKAQP